MAYPKVKPITLPLNTTSSSSYTVSIASLGLTLVNDEWLLVFVSCTATTGTLSTSSTGWSEVRELDVSSGCRMAAYKCKVASGTAADLVVAATAPGMWLAAFVQVADSPAADCILDSVSVDGGSASSVASAAYTPTESDCMVFYFGTARSSSSADVSSRFLSPEVVGEVIDYIAFNSGGITSAICLGTVQQNVAEATAKTMYSGATNRLGVITVVVKNDTGGAKAMDCRAGITKMAWLGSHGNMHEALGSVTWGAISTFCPWTGGTIAGLGVSATAATHSVNSSVTYFWGLFSSLFSTVNAGGTDVWVGGWIPTTATFDVTGKFLSFEWASEGATDDVLGNYGLAIALGDDAAANTGKAVIFQVSPKSLIRYGLNTYMVSLETATTIETEGTIDATFWQNIKKIGFLWVRSGTNANSRGFRFRNVLLHSSSTMVGGCEARPLDVKYLDSALNGWGYTGCCELQGDAVLVKTSIQFGDGSTATYVNTSGTLLNTPQTYSTVTQAQNNIAAGALTVGLYTGASDTIKMISSATSAGAQQNFAINASSNVSASYDFTGEAFKGWAVTWATNAPVTGAVYSGCGTVAFKGADVSGCTISNTTAVAGEAACSWDANGAVVTSTTIDVTGSAAGYHIELGASVTAITLASVTFTGTPATDKVHVLATTGTVTITVSGTTSLAAGDVTSAGATIVIAAPSPTLSATVLANSRVVLYNNTTAAELDNAFVTGTSWSKVITSGASNGNSLTLHVFKEGYAEFSTSFLYSASDTSILVSQVTDPVIQAFRTEDSITDYTTITEFNIYAPTIYIRSNDADGTSKISRLATYYNGVLTTEDGARYFRGGMSMLSTGAVRINKSSIALLLENVNATKSLRFSDEISRRLYTDDGTTIIAPSSQPYSIEYAYGGVPDVVETGVSGLTGPESSQLMGLPSASTTASAVMSHADMVKLIKRGLNKFVLNPADGTVKVYDDDGTTLLYSGLAYSDAAGSTLYDGTAAVHHTTRLT